MAPDFVYKSMAPKNKKAPCKSIFEKILKFYDQSREFSKTYNFKNELFSYMLYLYVVRVGGAAPDPREPQAFKMFLCK